MSLVQDLNLLIHHLNDASQRVAVARRSGSTAGPQLAAALRESQRAEPAEIQARIVRAERDTLGAENLLREAVDGARRYGATL